MKKTQIAAAVLLMCAGVAQAAVHTSLKEDTRLEGQTVSGTYDFATDNNRWYGGVYISTDHNITSVGNSYSGVTFLAKEDAQGGVWSINRVQTPASTALTASFTNDRFVGNTLHTNDFATKQTEWVAGGALQLKGVDAVFTDTEFKDNVVWSELTGKGGAAVGGALFLDKKINTNVVADTTATIRVTKDMAYTGNTVKSATPEGETLVYGGSGVTSGGFAFLDRKSSLTFDVAEDATLTLGVKGAADKNADTIASSMTKLSDVNNYGGFNQLNKNGAGTFLVNSSLSDYYGVVNVNGGQMVVNADWKIRNKVTVNGGATLDISAVEIDVSNLNAGRVEHGLAEVGASDNYSASVVVNKNGTLIASMGQVWEDTEHFAQLADVEAVKVQQYLTFDSAILKIDEEGEYTTSDLEKLVGSLKPTNTTLYLPFATLAAGETAELVDGVVQANTTVTADVGTDGTLTVTDAGAQALVVNTDAVTLDGKLTLTGGEDKPLVATTDGQTVASFTVGSGSELQVGQSEAAQTADFSKVTLPATTVVAGTVTLVGTEAAGQAFEMQNGAQVNVGTEDTAARLEVQTLNIGAGSKLVIDPEFTAEGINGASVVTAAALTDNTIAGDVAVDSNSIFAVGATADQVKSSFNTLASQNGLTWAADGVASMVYLDAPIELTGNMVVNGTTVGTGLTVNSNGMLMLNASNMGDTPVVGAADVALESGSYIGLVNASESTITLTSGTLTDNGASVVTDNPFVTASVDAANKAVVGKMSVEGGMSAIGSLGLQAMTRRADTMLATSIADRTSYDQELGQGVNLWADVTGERYESDKLDFGGSFKSDMAYGAFGGDVALTDAITAGAAVQYGKGKLRSPVSSIRNDVENYGLSFYGTMKFDGFKLAGELAYVQGKNDITASQAALNQSVDTKMYSAGIRAMTEIDAAALRLVPSIGLRVSQLKTDALNIGSLKIEDQKQTLVQMPIALRATVTPVQTGGWTVAPSMKVAYVPTFGDKEIKVFGTEMDVIDTNPVQIDLGMRGQKGNLLLNANFLMGFGNDGTNAVGGKIGAKYLF